MEQQTTEQEHWFRKFYRFGIRTVLLFLFFMALVGSSETMIISLAFLGGIQVVYLLWQCGTKIDVWVHKKKE